MKFEVHVKSFVLILVVSRVSSKPLLRSFPTFNVAEEKPELYELSDEERFAAFCQAFSITEREQEVLEALLVSDENVQDIAVKLSISRAVLYRHITSLNNKTQTKSRIGLLQFYYTWKDKK